ncbi:MAG: efflux RND transporter periplasmic adaptor subunit [Myxococcota bacterium]
MAGEEVELLTHLTVLDGFGALDRAELELEVENGSFNAGETDRVQPGIFRLAFTPPAPGTYQGRLVVRGPVPDTIEDLEFRVFATAEAAAEAISHGGDEGLIELLKEQQWGVPFGTEFARAGTVVDSIEVAGEVTTPPGGSAEVGAPVAGRIVPPRAGLPLPGTAVRRGELLASLAPAPASPEGAARARLAVVEAEARAAAAESALGRAERLIADEAISQREFDDATREARVATEAVRAANRAAALFSGSGRAGSFRLTAPVDGVLTHVEATPGSSVAQGDVLFRIVAPNELWIRARIPEQDAARLRPEQNAHYQVAGLDAWRPIELGEGGASVVTVGRVVDPVSRTVDLVYSLSDPDPALRVGGLVRVQVPAGDAFTGVVVPESAIVRDEGRQVVYLQVDGEHFREQVVRVGPRGGDAVGIRSGIEVGNRVVTEGANLVRLADRGSSTEAHGHVH